MSRVWLRPNLDYRALLRVQRMSAKFTPALMEGPTVYDLTHANGDPCDGCDTRDHTRTISDELIAMLNAQSQALADASPFDAAEWDV